MAKAHQFNARIEDGRLKVGLRALQAMRRDLARWQRCPVTVTIEKQYAIRGTTANSLYWTGYVNPVAEYTGNSTRFIHAYFKQKFLPKQRIEIVDRQTGVVVDTQELAHLTTTTLTTNEFSEYLHDIAEWVLDEFHGTVTVGSNREAA